MFLQQLFEAIDKQHAAFCFGRMNPPTIGHEQLINTVANAAAGGDYFVFVSQTQDSKKNPLDYQTKIKFVKAMFANHAGHVVEDTQLKTIMQVAAWLYSKGYRKVTFVAGSDRLENFKELLEKYNGVEGPAGMYKFDSINFVSSGERDPDADGVAGVSASAARAAAAAGDLSAFAQATGAGKLSQSLYDSVREGMGIKDQALAVAERTIKNISEARPEVYSNIVDATINARKQNKKVVKSAGGYFKVTDKSDPAKELVPNEEYLSKQRSIIARVRSIDAEINKNFKAPFEQERTELLRSLPKDPTTREFINVDDWVDGLQNLRSTYFSKEYNALEIEKDKLRANLKKLIATNKSYIELSESSGYIPKNKREAKDPRYSTALTVDVKPGAINKNLKAFKL
jgi:hypothetical protein